MFSLLPWYKLSKILFFWQLNWPVTDLEQSIMCEQQSFVSFLGRGFKRQYTPAFVS